MFGDPSNNPLKLQTVRIGDICNVETGGTPDRRNPSYWGGGNIPWIKTAEVRDNTVFRAEEFITQKGLDSSNAAIFPKDSILVAMYGQGVTRGKVAKLGIEAATNQACAVILPSKRYNTDYLFHLLRFSYDRLRSLGRGGNQPNLNLSMVREFEITMPPIQSQERFALFAKEVEDVRTAQEALGARIDTLFDSLLQVWYGR
jgi:type I restriction enzyme S subunit